MAAIDRPSTVCCSRNCSRTRSPICRNCSAFWLSSSISTRVRKSSARRAIFTERSPRRFSHVAHQSRQLPVDALDDRETALCFRQAEQSQRAVCLDFEKALRQGAGADRRQLLVDDENAHEAVCVRQKIGGDQRAFVFDVGGDDVGPRKRTPEI